MKKVRKIILYGDSIGKGVEWNSSRQRYCISKEACLKHLDAVVPFEVENRSVMGNTVTRCLAAFQADKAEKGAVVVFELGGNDCDMPWKDIAEDPSREYSPNVPLNEFYRDLREMVRLARRRRMTPILAIPIPLDGERYYPWVSRGLNKDNILAYLGDPVQMSRWQERYAAAVRDIAWQEKVSFIDLREYILRNREFKSLYCEDGIHLNDKGQRYLFDCLMESGIIPLAGRRKKDTLPAVAKCACAVC